jgi:hypothetical protein
MGKGVPQEMGGDPHKNGKHDQRKAGKCIDRKGVRSKLQSLSRALGQTRGQGFLGVAVEEPEDEQAQGQVEDKNTQGVVAKAAMMCEGKEVLEIGSERADDHGRQDETGTAKWEGGRGMGQRKRHYENYDGFCVNMWRCSAIWLNDSLPKFEIPKLLFLPANITSRLALRFELIYSLARL